MRSFRTFALSLAAAACLVLLAVGLLAGSSQAAAWSSTREYFEMMDPKFTQFTGAPGEVTRGTGFKPYMRYRTFAEPRLDPATGSMTPGARWEVFQQMKAIEQQYGSRSETWFSLGPINVAGRCLAIEVHPTNPEIAWAGFASSGFWKTTNGGSTWTPLGDYLPTLSVGAIEVDPADPDRIWIGTGEGWGNVDAIHGVGVLVSHDGGVTFEPTGYTYAMSSGRDVYELEYNPATGTLMVAADNGLWRSTDGGATFTAIYDIGQWHDVELKPGSTSIMYASSRQWADFGFYRSTDDGATWTRITDGTPTELVQNNRFALSPSNPEVVYWAIDRGNDTMNIYKSTNGGTSFTNVFSGTHYGSQGWYDLTIDVDPQNANRVFSGGVYYYRSTNGGASFTTHAGNVHVDFHAGAWSPSHPTHFWVGSDGGVWRSTNSGDTFVDKNTGLTTLQFYAINHSDSMPTRALGGTQDNGTYLYNNNLNWDYILGGDGFFCEVDRTKPDTLYGEVYYGNHYRSVNGGQTMAPKNSGINEQGPWSTPTHMDFNDPAIIWTAHNTRIFRTTNSMNLWTYMNNPSGLGGGRSIHQCRAHPEVVVVVSGARVWLTTDNGTNWINRTSGLVTANTISDVHVHPTDPNTFVITCQTYSSNVNQVHKTTDQGLTWFPIDEGLPNEPCNTIEMDPQNPDWYFLGTDLGVYVSFDAGANWLPFNTGLPHVVVADLRIHNTARLLRAGTHGRGLWEVDISTLSPTAVDEFQGKPVQPLTLRIFGTPATSQTTIRYGIREPGQVNLGLFDLQGREVRSLVNNFEYPIIGHVDVDVSDLPNGVYFARLRANGSEVSQKLVVQK